MDTNFDEESLSVYGATLQEQVTEGKDAQFKTDETLQKMADEKEQTQMLEQLV